MMPQACGVLCVLKPPGMTSHDVVSYARALLGVKLGHAGTLDPMAAGVLVLTVGDATRLSEHLSGHDKTYRAEFLLGIETDALDLEGKVVARASAVDVSLERVREAIGRLTGEVEMVPPMYSAVKQDGRRLYELARKGEQVDRKPRRITVSRFELVDFAPGTVARALCEIECSKGTYVRSLAQMLGESLGCGACLGFLLRLSQGPHRLDDCLSLEELSARARDGELADALVPLTRALPLFPHVTLSSDSAAPLRNGNPVAVELPMADGQQVLVSCEGKTLCLAEVTVSEGVTRLQPRKVFPG